MMRGARRRHASVGAGQMCGRLGQFRRHHVVKDGRFQGYSVTFWGISSCKRNPLPLINSEVDINFRLKIFELILQLHSAAGKQNDKIRFYNNRCNT